jgi:hypothetical protein
LGVLSRGRAGTGCKEGAERQAGEASVHDHLWVLEVAVAALVDMGAAVP